MTNSVSVRRMAQQLDISYSSIQVTIKRNLSIKPYKIQISQKLQIKDFGRRQQLATLFIEMTEMNSTFSEELIMSDKAYFCLNFSVNKQNSRIWVTHNPESSHYYLFTLNMSQFGRQLRHKKLLDRIFCTDLSIFAVIVQRVIYIAN